MNLAALFPGHDVDATIEVTGLTPDSRKVKPGFVFAALQGVAADGRDYIPQAIENGALQKLGALFDACHTSLRDDYEVSCDELEALVKAANASKGVFGSRMVGAGFGGCVLSVCNSDRATEVATEIRANYATVTGEEPWQHIVEPAKPARVITQP